jgi:hypothetical protein
LPPTHFKNGATNLFLSFAIVYVYAEIFEDESQW